MRLLSFVSWSFKTFFCTGFILKASPLLVALWNGDHLTSCSYITIHFWGGSYFRAYHIQMFHSKYKANTTEFSFERWVTLLDCISLFTYTVTSTIEIVKCLAQQWPLNLFSCAGAKFSFAIFTERTELAMEFIFWCMKIHIVRPKKGNFIKWAYDVIQFNSGLKFISLR